jgi:hypothetical protein
MIMMMLDRRCLGCWIVATVCGSMSIRKQDKKNNRGRGMERALDRIPLLYECQTSWFGVSQTDWIQLPVNEIFVPNNLAMSPLPYNVRLTSSGRTRISPSYPRRTGHGARKRNHPERSRRGRALVFLRLAFGVVPVRYLRRPSIDSVSVKHDLAYPYCNGRLGATMAVVGTFVVLPQLNQQSGSYGGSNRASRVSYPTLSSTL